VHPRLQVLAELFDADAILAVEKASAVEDGEGADVPRPPEVIHKSKNMSDAVRRSKLRVTAITSRSDSVHRAGLIVY
jgi:hypothetical protein